jgi:YggT family protein
MTQNLPAAGIYLVQAFFGLYVYLIMTRFLMQIARTDYYNPICQAIVKITDPGIKRVRTFVPTLYGIDFATLLVALVIQTVALMLIMLIAGRPFFDPYYIAWALLGLASIVLTIYFLAMLVVFIASWLAPDGGHPALSLVNQLTEPLRAPVRRLVPPMGGLDLSFLFVIVALHLVDLLVIDQIRQVLGMSSGLVYGL